MTDDNQPQAGDEARAVLYTQPHCHACRQVERYLAERDVPFESRDVFTDPTALEEIAERGYLATPVTRIGDEWIAGFHRHALDEALARLPAR